MRRAVFILFVLAASLLVTPSVAAQTPGGGLLVVRVCGANGCRAIFNGLFLLDPSAAAAEASGAPSVGPFYVLEPSNYRAKDQTDEASGPTTPAFFVPGAGVLRARPMRASLPPRSGFGSRMRSEPPCSARSAACGRSRLHT